VNTNLGTNVEGRMIFFVQPSSVIRTELITELIKQEYMVALISDAANAKRLFYQYPSCLAFLNIDDGFSEEQWLAFVQEVRQEPLLANVRLGILTYNPDRKLAEEYLINRRVACGFVKLSLKMADSIAIITKVLEANEAKGRRKYLRVRCDENSRLSFKDSRDLIEGRIVELSSVGMTCVLNPDKRWPHHAVFESMRLSSREGFVPSAELSWGAARWKGTKGRSTSFCSTPTRQASALIRSGPTCKGRSSPPSTAFCAQAVRSRWPGPSTPVFWAER